MLDSIAPSLLMYRSGSLDQSAKAYKAGRLWQDDTQPGRFTAMIVTTHMLLSDRQLPHWKYSYTHSSSFIFMTRAVGEGGEPNTVAQGWLSLVRYIPTMVIIYCKLYQLQ